MLLVPFVITHAFAGGSVTNAKSNAPPFLIRSGVAPIDVHMHAIDPIVWNEKFPREKHEKMFGHQCMDAEEHLAMTIQAMDRFGIQKGILQGHLHLVRQWVERYPNRFIPAFTPEFGDTNLPPVADPKFLALDHEALAQKFGRDLDSGKYKLLGELTHPFSGFPLNWKPLYPYLRVAEKHGVPALFHTGDPMESTLANLGANSNPSLLADVAREFPQLKIVACKGGLENNEKLIGVMTRYTNVWADVSVLNWENDEDFQSAIQRFRKAGLMDRVLFGSDQCLWPELIGRAVRNTDAFLTKEEATKVFRLNACRLLGLSP